jgi:hypothetical protein
MGEFSKSQCVCVWGGGMKDVSNEGISDRLSNGPIMLGINIVKTESLKLNVSDVLFLLWNLNI